MKAFVASLILFGVMLLLILGNTLYVRHTTNELETRLRAIAESGDVNEAEALWADWSRTRKRLRFSEAADELDQIDDCLTELCIVARKKDADELALAVRLSLNAIGRLQD